MSQHSSQTFLNRLLAILPEADRAFLQAQMEPAALRLHEVLETPGQAIPFVYFPLSGIVSVVATFGGTRAIEVGLLGLDGMTGTALVQYDDQSPCESMVQVSGQAMRVPASHFLTALRQSPTMRMLLSRYARAFAIQVAFTALANGRAKLEERLARWLLMVHDRVVGDRIVLTHEYMAVMLGVRRPGVTVALHILEGKGVIQSHRGEVVIKDREGLAAEAGGGYGQPETEYARLLGSEPGKRTDESAASSAEAQLSQMRPAK